MIVTKPFDVTLKIWQDENEFWVVDIQSVEGGIRKKEKQLQHAIELATDHLKRSLILTLCQ